MDEGEIVSLLGRNGVGRSTTCKAIMGLVAADGTVRYRGRDIAGLRTDLIARAGIGYVPEDRQVFPTLTRAPEPGTRAEEGQPFRPLDISTTCSGCSPISPQRQNNAAGRAVGRRAADADHVPHADGRSGPDPDR